MLSHSLLAHSMLAAHTSVIDPHNMTASSQQEVWKQHTSTPA